MKVTIYSLLLINLGVLAWFSWFADENEPPTGTSEFSIEESLPQLMLASEVDSASDAGSANRGNMVTAVAQELLCVSLGPFQDDPHAAVAAARLSQRGYALSQRAADGQIRAGFWVNIVAGTMRDDAEDMADRLRDRGVSDFYIVPGDDSNVISLGVYSGQERAQRRHDELAALGFAPVIDDRLQGGTVQWLDFSMLDPAMINPTDFTTGSGLPVELISLPCADNDAASG